MMMNLVKTFGQKVDFTGIREMILEWKKLTILKKGCSM